MKKNTLLYLEKNLVEKAKKSNINISEIAEKALREELQEYRDRNDPEYMFENATTSFLPYRITRITFKDDLMFKNNQYTFKNTNLILGGNASGKSLLLRALQGNPSRIKNITLEIESKPKKTLGKDYNQSLLIDDLPLTEDNSTNFIKWLKDKYKDLQLILTSVRHVKGFENTIKLKHEGKKTNSSLGRKTRGIRS